MSCSVNLVHVFVLFPLQETTPGTADLVSTNDIHRIAL